MRRQYEPFELLRACVVLLVFAAAVNTAAHPRASANISTQSQKSQSAEPHEGTEKYPYTNRLIRAKSPYLLLHAHNPVDWYPWGNEAFEKARKENKPIFLSIGYFTSVKKLERL